MKALFFFIINLFFAQIIFAQTLEYQNLQKKDFEITIKGVDSTAHAFHLDERGKSIIQLSDNDRGLRVYHNYKTRIKIKDQDGYKHANFTLPLYKFGNDFEYIDEIVATTYNIENGIITATPLEKKNIINENKSEYLRLTKFTLPNLKPGSIIEVAYRVVSPDIFNFRSWEFQSYIPKIKSQYNVLIPAITKYNVTLKGPLKLNDTKSKISYGCFTAAGVKSDCSDILYAMNNIPAFHEEVHMLAPKNYLSAVNFELEEMTNAHGGTTKYTKNWNDVDRELMLDRNFGGQLKKTNLFKEIFEKHNVKGSTDYETANNIIKWISSHIRWNNYYGKYSQHGVEDAIQKRSGNVADINLALVAAFNAMNIEAYPVLVSTRDNGIPHNLHPVISDFNYVIAGVKIGDETILADATDPLLRFSDLPLRCINNKGRIIYSKKSSEWIPLVNNSISYILFHFDGKLDKSGTADGNLTISVNGLHAYNKRKEIRSFGSEEEYFEKLDEKLTNIDIKKSSVDNLDSIDYTLIENIEAKIKIATKDQSNTYYINPIFINRITQNPFNLDERNYDVDLGAKQDENHEIILELPEGFTLVNAPKNLNMALPDKSAVYVFKSEVKDNKLRIQQHLSLKKAIYDSDEYFGLKEFYSRIIQNLKVDFQFKSN